VSRCQICGTDVLYPFECNYCDGKFCVDHRLPETHSCQGLPRWPPFWYQKNRLIADNIGKKSTAQSVGYSEPPQARHLKGGQKTHPKAAILTVLLVSSVLGIYFLSLAHPRLVVDIGTALKVIMENAAREIQRILESTGKEQEGVQEIRLQVFYLINQERVSRGLPLLRNNTILVIAAQEWSDSLAYRGKLEHGDFEDRMRRIGYLSRYVCGEIIAFCEGYSEGVARVFVDGWLESPAHKDIMLTSMHGEMGVGVTQSGDKYYAVVDFIFYG